MYRAFEKFLKTNRLSEIIKITNQASWLPETKPVADLHVGEGPGSPLILGKKRNGRRKKSQQDK